MMVVRGGGAGVSRGAGGGRGRGDEGAEVRGRGGLHSGATGALCNWPCPWDHAGHMLLEHAVLQWVTRKIFIKRQQKTGVNSVIN